MKKIFNTKLTIIFLLVFYFSQNLYAEYNAKNAVDAVYYAYDRGVENKSGNRWRAHVSVTDNDEHSHEFWIHPIKFEDQDEHTIIRIHISHKVSGEFDEQIYYDFFITSSGECQFLRLDVNQRSWISEVSGVITDMLFSSLIQYFTGSVEAGNLGGKIGSDFGEYIAKKIKSHIIKDWKSALDHLIVVCFDRVIYKWKSWRSFDKYPRCIGDVNGDGKIDIIGFHKNSVMVSLSDGRSFGDAKKWSDGFVELTAWKNFNEYPRYVADVNGDGKADIVGFGKSGVSVALSIGDGFGNGSLWTNEFGINYGGWKNFSQYPRCVADVNGDGKADIIGFSYDGVNVALSNGEKFERAVKWRDGFGIKAGWKNFNQHPRFIADVDGDGKADIIGFSDECISVALSDGRSFGRATVWHDDYCVRTGWISNDKYPRCVADVNGDGKADIIGFGENGVIVSLSNGHGFNRQVIWREGFNINASWTCFNECPRYIADVNKDGKADIIGFCQNNVSVALSNGRSFGRATAWHKGFCINTDMWPY